MTTADLPIAIDRDLIARFCRERGIRSLSLFGSVLRDDFDPARSDIDVLAEFAPGALRGVGLRYFGFGEELGAILGVSALLALLALALPTRRALRARPVEAIGLGE